MSVLSSSSYDDEVVPTHAALQEAGQKVGAGSRSIHHAGLIAVVEFFVHPCDPVTHTPPKSVINDPKFRLLQHDPFRLRPHSP